MMLNLNILEGFFSLLKITWSLQQFKVLFIEFLILILNCKEINPKEGNAKGKDFFSAIGKVGFVVCNISKTFLKHLSINDVR